MKKDKSNKETHDITTKEEEDLSFLQLDPEILNEFRDSYFQKADIDKIIQNSESDLDSITGDEVKLDISLRESSDFININSEFINNVVKPNTVISSHFASLQIIV